MLLQDEPNEITEPEPEPEMEVEEAPKFDMCKHPYKDWEKIMPQSQKLSLVMVGRMSRGLRPGTWPTFAVQGASCKPWGLLRDGQLRWCS